MRVSFPRLLVVVAATAVLFSSVPGPAQGATAPATSAANGLAGIDAMTATVFQQDQSSFSGLAIRARLHSAKLLDNVEFLPTVEYWRNSSKVDAYDLRTVRRDATLGTDARWMFPGEAWRPYAGAGVAVHFLSDEVDRRPAFERLSETVLSIVNFRFRPAGMTEPDLDRLNRTIVNRLVGSGSFFLAPTVLKGRTSVRACIVNFRTTEADLTFLLDEAERIGEELNSG